MRRKRTKSGKVRLAEVAELAGVSPITASRFFRKPEALSTIKRARVESAAKQLGYVPNLAARALASQRTEVIGVLIPSLTNNVFSDVLRGIDDVSEGSRYSIQISNTRYSVLEEEKLLRIFLAQKPAGLIITGIDQTVESYSMLEGANCPIVQIMEIGPNPVDMMIGLSQYEAGRAAIVHLLAQGFRRIGFLAARMDPRVQHRFEGYQAVMKEAGLLDPHLIATTHLSSSASLGSTLFADLLARAPDIDAVFCVNDDLALGVLFECRRRNISVPKQMAIIGFNDLEFMECAFPTLSSVRTNRYEMGRRAAAMVIGAIEGRRPKIPVVDLGFTVMERQSSQPRRSVG